jgi:flagellin
MGINTNIPSMNVLRNLNRIQEQMKSSLSKLSSGSRIPTAKDDAAGLAIGEVLDALMRETGQSMNNISDGLSMLQVAEGATQEISNNLGRIRELSVQAQNGTYSDQDRAAIQQEVDQLTAEIDRISQSADFNGKELLNGGLDVDIAVGADEYIHVSAGDMQAASMGVDALDVTTPGGAASAIDSVDAAIEQVSLYRSDLGAVSNRLSSTLNSLRDTYETIAASKSRIMDADYAKETARLAQLQIKEQASVAMLGQANVSPFRALKLLG